MSAADYIALGIVAFAAVCAVISIVKQRKSTKGCCGSCGGCPYSGKCHEERKNGDDSDKT